MYNIQDQERAAYISGDTDRAELLARIAELEAQVEALENQIDDTQTLDDWERNNGPAHEYKQFFEDCFERLAGHYPAPSVTSDYDKSVIFDAIERGENSATC